nr:VF530 family DNA-binding protein [Providencia alcalifaciens]
MNERLSKDPLHGITLEMQVTALVNHYGWSQLGRIIKINCFNKDPSIKSSFMLEDDSIEEAQLPSTDPWENHRK